MDNEQRNPHGLGRERRAIEMLARESDVPFETVEEIYIVESAKLECVARIQTYVPVLAARRVKMRLRSRATNGTDAG